MTNFAAPLTRTWILLLLATVGRLEGVEVTDSRATEADGLYAYYTKVHSGEPFERFCRTGEDADIVVNVGQLAGQLVFWRGRNYLPYWKTAAGRWFFPESVPRRGDGDARMPDRVNSYSHVRIIREDPDHVLVHWRYLPQFGGTNPHTGVDATKFVEELFLVTGDGRVTRTIRKGTQKYDDWNDPRNRTSQQFRLTGTGIELVKEAEAHSSGERHAVQGIPIKRELAARPSLDWRFDEGVGDTTLERVTGRQCAIAGHKALWKQGVSGTALQFDGYNTLVELPEGKLPTIDDALTLEGWVAIAAYPWNWAPIVHRGDDDGYALGVDGHGRPGLRLRVGERRFELSAATRLERNRWYHVAGTFDGATGQARVFVDGEPVATRTLVRGRISAPDVPVKIGKGKNRRPVDPVRKNTFSDSYSFDGLLDEIRIYDTTLRPERVAQSYRLFRPEEWAVSRPDMDYRRLPRADTDGRFGATYLHLKFYESWDVLWRFGDYPDVVVGFDTQPCRFVFWRGTGYIPMLVNEKQQWYSNEFNETWSRSGGRGCQEPMSDKEAYTNHVRILENTDARVVVHWRYPLIDVLRVRANYDPKTGWCDTSDWYYSIYPDGVAVKRMRLWTSGPRNHEWHEAMAILGPNQHPEQVIDTDPALVLADLEGNAVAYKWTDGPPEGVDYDDKKIHLVKYKAEYSPFTIGDFTEGDVYSGEVTKYSVFPSWNHWPVAQMPSDGRYASFPDRTAHSSLTHVRLPDHRAEFGDRPFQEKLVMEGMTNRPIEQLARLARSWLSPPELEVVGGCRSGGYDRAGRAFELVATESRMSFRILASPDRPLLNPCFEILDWSSSNVATLAIDGRRRTAGPSFRQGIARDPDGRRKMLIWVELEATKPLTITIAGARPVLVGRRCDPPVWAQEPQVVRGKLEITMAVRPPSDADAVEYRFERTSDDGATDDSGWVTTLRYTDRKLSPNTTYRYRVKGRNRYLQETDGSEVRSARTPGMPAPVVWKLTEGEGRKIADTGGRYAGRLHGEADWVSDRHGASLRLDGQSSVVLDDGNQLSTSGDFTWAAWIQTRRGGTIVARAGRAEAWERGGKVLFVAGGRLMFDVGWVGAVASDRASLDDGEWHHVAVTSRAADGSSEIVLFADGRPVGRGRLEVGRFPESRLPLKIGYCNEDFPPRRSGFVGRIRDVRWYRYGLTRPMIAEISRRPTKR